MKPSILFLLFGLAATPAAADLSVAFREGAPKDRFVLTNTGSCAIERATVAIDLRGSQGNLIFDTTRAGAGVEVFQPFEVVSGAKFLENIPDVTDGQQLVTLQMRDFAAGAEIVITTDLDDTGGAREITVNGSELAGAQISVVSQNASSEATFGARPDVTARFLSC